MIALLDLPEQTTIALDSGPSNTLRKSLDAIIVRDIVPVNRFHFLVVRGGLQKTDSSSYHSSVVRSQSVGLHNVGILVLIESSTDMIQTNICDSPGWLIARKFDPYTEEVSSLAPNDVTMERIRSILDPTRQPHKQDNLKAPIINYKSLVEYPESEREDNGLELDMIWSDSLTHYITPELLSRHGLTGHGDKVVPSYFTAGDEEDMLKTYNAVVDNKERALVDGISIVYPLIPTIDRKKNNNQKHTATREYLKSLSPDRRTQLLFFEENPGLNIFRHVLDDVYDGKWTLLLGDVQLSFILFLCLGCFQSFEFWRDVLSMLSFVPTEVIDNNIVLFVQLLKTLCGQTLRFDEDLFTDVDYSEGSFLFPTLRRLADVCRRSQGSKNLLYLKDFELILEKKTKIEITHTQEDDQSIDSDSERDEHFDDGLDPPVLLASNEIEAALNRIKNNTISHISGDRLEKENRASYPLLFAATLEHEDVLMACARILDESVDASLLREVKQYLENVEANIITKD